MKCYKAILFSLFLLFSMEALPSSYTGTVIEVDGIKKCQATSGEKTRQFSCSFSSGVTCLDDGTCSMRSYLFKGYRRGNIITKKEKKYCQLTVQEKKWEFSCDRAAGVRCREDGLCIVGIYLWSSTPPISASETSKTK